MGLTAFGANSFTLGTGSDVNASSSDYASWTFRKAPGFFDVVTYTGNGSTQTISHNLGSVPGCIIVKRTDSSRDWAVYHRSLSNGQALALNNTTAARSFAGWGYTTPTATDFYLGADSDVNNASGTYVAYIFAHDDQSFGTNGNESIIKCGSYTGTGSGNINDISLGFEAQWVLIKDISRASDSFGDADWNIYDMMRGFNAQDSKKLHPNLSSAELSGGRVVPTPTGFKIDNESNIDINASGDTYIYMAIRRPHKPPTAATEVFAAAYKTGATTTPAYISGFPIDAVIRHDDLTGNTFGSYILSRLTGTKQMATSSAAAETNNSSMVMDYMNGYNSDAVSGTNTLSWMFKRAPGFMDVVAADYPSSGTAIPHNLGVAPELIIHKPRDGAINWIVGSDYLSNTSGWNQYLELNSSNAESSTSTVWDQTAPTATHFTLGSYPGSSYKGVFYLFATLSGISKVGTYSGTGSNIDVDCGFSAGARFVLIKRLTFAGSWYVWDTTRGIVSGNDPYILLDNTNAQVTDQDNIDPINSGFRVVSNLGALNATGSTYLFLAIA